MYGLIILVVTDITVVVIIFLKLRPAIWAEENIGLGKDFIFSKPLVKKVDHEWVREKQRKEASVSKVGECKVEGRHIFGRYSGQIDHYC